MPHGCEHTFGMDWHRYTCMPTIDVDGLLSDGGEPCFGEMMRPAAWHRLGGKRHHWNEPKLCRGKRTLLLSCVFEITDYREGIPSGSIGVGTLASHPSM